MKRFMTKKGVIVSIILILMLSLILMSGCTQEEAPASEGNEQEAPAEEGNSSEIILATTTSTENSGLLDEIIPVFTEEIGIDVKVVAVGTGNAIQMGEDGEADVLLVHAKASEEEFVEAGHGVERVEVMYNDFIIVGSEEDPAGISENPEDVVAALTAITEAEEKFVSRGDDSGTHKKELTLWDNADIEPSGDWYIEAGRGMGDTIQMAEEMLGYTLSDRATYLSMADDLDATVLSEGDEQLFNQYGVIAVNPEKNDMINNEGAQEFIDWIVSADTQEIIKGFGVEEYGQPLFIPNAK